MATPIQRARQALRVVNRLERMRSSLAGSQDTDRQTTIATEGRADEYTPPLCACAERCFPCT